MTEQSKRDAAVAVISGVVTSPKMLNFGFNAVDARQLAPHIADALAAAGLLCTAPEPSGDVVERVANAIAQAEIGNPVLGTTDLARAAIAAMPKQAATQGQIEQAALFMFTVRTYTHRRPDYARKCWEQVIDDDDREAWRRTARDLMAFAGITVEDGEQHG